jgi:hypothetical protein
MKEIDDSNQMLFHELFAPYEARLEKLDKGFNISNLSLFPLYSSLEIDTSLLPSSVRVGFLAGGYGATYCVRYSQ